VVAGVWAKQSQEEKKKLQDTHGAEQKQTSKNHVTTFVDQNFGSHGPHGYFRKKFTWRHFVRFTVTILFSTFAG
jgi:hypothetical protein